MTAAKWLTDLFTNPAREEEAKALIGAGIACVAAALAVGLLLGLMAWM